MSSTYTGVPGNIGALTPVTTAIPSDADPLSAASVDVALQKLTDYIAQLETGAGYGLWVFSGTPGNAASTTYGAFAPGMGYGSLVMSTDPGTLSPLPQTIRVPTAGRINIATGGFASNTVGGPVTITLLKNNVATAVTQLFNAGQVATWFTFAGTPVSVAAGDYLRFTVANGVGVTQSLGISMFMVGYTLG